MDWGKINFDELGCVFKSTRLGYDLNCVPSPLKIDCILDMLHYYQIDDYSSGDIHRLFELLRLKSPRSGKESVPSRDKIQERLTAAGGASTQFSGTYALTLKKAKGKGLIADWVDYAVAHTDVCEAVSRTELGK